jgi:hypothetical protein
LLIIDYDRAQIGRRAVTHQLAMIPNCYV